MRTVLTLLLAALIVGCGSKINQSVFTRIKGNMSLQEVEGLLGPGKAMSDEEMLAVMKRGTENASGEIKKNADNLTIQAVQSYTGRVWTEGSRSIVIFLRDERVQLKYKDGF